MKVFSDSFQVVPQPLQTVLYLTLEEEISALAGVTQWTESWPVNQRIAGSIPSQGTCLGFRPGPQ